MKLKRLSNFIKENDMPRATAIRLIYNKELPAIKLGGNWYIDISRLEKKINKC